jgi:hypothetical protein
MSVKLTTTKRDVIAKRLLDHAFGKRLKEINSKKTAFADRLYASWFSEKDRKLMDSAPKGFFQKKETITGYVNGQFFRLTMSAEKPFPCSYESISLSSEMPIGEELSLLLEQGKTLDAGIAEQRLRIQTVLRSSTTLKGLLTQWPEIATLVADLNVEKPCTALALPLQSLNNVLGLPPT